jgi:glutathione-regulated potassium-efflux system ancillary protein KefF
MIAVIYAHPYPRHSRANRALLDAVGDLPDVRVRALYQLYPDFRIDVAAEQAALSEADLIVWQYPMQWYSVPSLFKLWLDKVLEYGWAHGSRDTALRGKDCLLAVTTGGDADSFRINGGGGLESFCEPLRATAAYCGMRWAVPFALHATLEIDAPRLAQAASRYRQRLLDWQLSTAATAAATVAANAAAAATETGTGTGSAR